MKRKGSPGGARSPAASASPSSASPASAGKQQLKRFFVGATVLLVEDGRGEGVSAKRAELFQQQIKAFGGTAEVLKAARITEGKRLTPEERDHKLAHVTHVVTGLPTARAVLEGLNLPLPAAEAEADEGKPMAPAAAADREEEGETARTLALTPTPSSPPKQTEQQQGQGRKLPFKIVRPDWVTACLRAQALVADTGPYDLPFDQPHDGDDDGGAAAASDGGTPAKRPRTGMVGAGSASAAGGAGGAAAAAAAAAPPPPSRAEIEARLDADFPDLDPATREAFIAYGGPLTIVSGKDFPRYACQRPTPHQHPNPALAAVFEELVTIYGALGDRERATHFGRALGVIRGWPRRIRRAEELKGAPYCQEKTLGIVRQVLEEGKADRLEGLKNVPRNMALVDLCRVHQVGSATAQKWYDEGYHSVEQILTELDAAPGGDVTQTEFYKRVRPSDEPLVGLIHFRDYIQPMDRATVAGLQDLVRTAALKVLAERGLGPETLLLETCGGYRRGKELSGDADVLVSCTQAQGQQGLREAVLRTIREEMGVETVALKEGQGAMQLGFGSAATEKPHEAMQSHDNMLTLVKFRGLYRRLDVICPPPDQWGFCVLGWSGTKQMEKDLRDYAEKALKPERAYHLSQQALYFKGKRVRNPKSPDGIFHREEEIWEHIGLKYLPPCLRWA